MHVHSDDAALIAAREARLRTAAWALVEFMDAGNVEDEPWNKGPDGTAPGRSLEFKALIAAVKKELA